MTARTWRYSGSGAVMMSEFVDGSACTKPPVDGPADWLSGDVAAAEFMPPVLLLLDVAPVSVWLLLPPSAPVPDSDELLPDWLLLPDEAAPNAARSTVASLVASAFFR